MQNFLLTMSAKNDGALFTKTYNFKSGNRVSEQELVHDFQEFNPAFTDIKVVSYMEITANFCFHQIIDNAERTDKVRFA